MQENLFKNIANKKERIQLLKDNAVSAETFTYSKHFTEEQIAEKKDDLARQDIDLLRLEEEKKEVVADLNQRIKKAKNERDINLIGIRTGVQEVNEVVYLINEIDEGIMKYINEDGDIVHTRPLRNDERQYRIIPKTGTEY